MDRSDFLMSILFAVILIKLHLLGYEFPFYIAIGLILSYSLVVWLSGIQISLLKKICNIGDAAFSEKYKDIKG